jgi:hypothetical protein
VAHELKLDNLIPGPMNFRGLRNSKYILSIPLWVGLAFAGASLDAAPVPPTPAPTPTAAATPTPSPAITPSNPSQVANYSGAQQAQYIATANTAFVAQRDAKFQAFLEARTAFEATGGIVPKGLTSKADVDARRDLLSKVRTANDDYLAFITTEDQTYRAELAKTPLIGNDIDALTEDFATKANIPRAIKLQQIEKDLLTCTDDMLADLAKWNGQWSVNAASKLVFKKKANLNAYSALEQKYNGLIAQMQALHPQPGPTASPSPGESPAASPSASPAATGAPAITP